MQGHRRAVEEEIAQGERIRERALGAKEGKLQPS
jgi:hypothetical protein